MFESLKLAVSDGVATITLDRPGSSVNVVTPAWIEEMTQVMAQVRDDDAVEGVIITSAKPSFMAGADLHHILEHATKLSPAEAFAFSQRASAMHRLVETIGKPVVAALNGYALGGGYELALSCTRRILADAPGSVVGLPEVTVGLLPGSGGTQRLPRMIGVERALDVLLEGRTYQPAAALELGLVDANVPPGDLLGAARAWLAERPSPVRAWDTKGFCIEESDGLLKLRTANLFMQATARLQARYGDNYPAPISILACVFEGVQVPIGKALKIESRHFARLLAGPVSRNIIRTLFINKGLAEKGARRPPRCPTRRVSKLGIIGAGMMGAGIAYVAAKAGINVILIDVTLEAAERGKAYSERLLGKKVATGAITQQDADATLDRIKPGAGYGDLSGAELVIEAVFEDLAIKAEVIAQAASAAGGDALLASNTSTLPITRLAEALPDRARFIGLHFFSPVDRMGLVEIILGKETDEERLAGAIDFVAQIGKTPIVVRDRRGFYTSRVFQTFIHEGLALVSEGVAPALIENAARLAGMPVGPLAVLDEVTLDLPLTIVRQAETEDPHYRRPASMAVIEKMVNELHRTSRRKGGAFYEYGGDGQKRLWRGLGDHFPLVADQPDVGEVKARLLYVQALETVRCLEEGVLTHPADADLGSVLGWGFPSWTGGTLSLIDTIGVADFVAECDRLAARHGERFSPPATLREMAANGQGFH